jgi:hypothetical protein
MLILLITILFIIILILGTICAKRGAQISSLKNQIEFLEYNIEQLTEKKVDPNRQR